VRAPPTNWAQTGKQGNAGQPVDILHMPEAITQLTHTSDPMVIIERLA